MAAKKRKPEEQTGRALLDMGCRQGALAHLPLSTPFWGRAEGEREWELFGAVPPAPPRPLVVASQDCDIAARTTAEPFVEFLEVEVSRDPGRLGNAAKGNSARSFLLSRSLDQGLIACASLRLAVKKHDLASVVFEEVMDGPTRSRFAPWLAGRYDRAALDDDLVETVVRPLVKAIEKLRKAGDALSDLLDRIEEIRMQPVDGPEGREIHLVVCATSWRDLGTAERASIQGWLVAEVYPHSPASVVLRTFEDLSVEAYLATIRIPLDHFSQD